MVNGPIQLDYENPRERWKRLRLNRWARMALSAVLIVMGLVAAGIGNKGKGDYSLLALVGIGGVIAGFCVHFGEQDPGRRRVSWIIRIQMVIALAMCLVALVVASEGFRFLPEYVQLRKVPAEFERWWPLFAAGLIWFVCLRIWIAMRRHFGGEDFARVSSDAAQAIRRRRIWLAGLGIFLCICAIPVVQLALESIRERRGFAACMNYRAPADMVVFTEDPGEADRLSGMDGYDVPSVFLDPNFAIAREVGRIEHQPDELWRVRTGWMSGATAFLHGRRSPNGKLRFLVHVRMTIHKAHPDSATRVSKLNTCTIARGEWPVSRAELQIHLGADDKLRVFAGQPDPADPSRFSIPHEVNGVRGVIIGRLENSGQVSLHRPIASNQAP